MYQNTLYDDRDILSPFNAMKLLNHFDKENTKLKEENEQLKSDLNKCEDALNYYKVKCTSWETGLIQTQRDNEQLKQLISELGIFLKGVMEDKK